MNPSPILQLEEITKRFARNAAPAVDSVTLTLQRGELLALLGPSGCGKTTLLRAIAGFERDLSGKIAIGDRVVAKPGYWLPPERRQVGMVFQDFALFPHLTVWQNIAFGLQSQGHEAKQQVRSVLGLVGLDGLENRYPHELSGGQQQRVALARALAPRPSLVLLDEPLSDLDAAVRLRLRQELRNILKAAEASAIFVTHDQEEALSIADRVAVMRSGRVEQCDTPEKVYRHPASRFIAKFVTQANLLPARRQGRVWETELGNFSLSPEQIRGEGDAGELVICREDIGLESDRDSRVYIKNRQFLGREYRYSLHLPSGTEIIALSSNRTALEPGTAVRIILNFQSLQLFASPHSAIGEFKIYRSPIPKREAIAGERIHLCPRYERIESLDC